MNGWQIGCVNVRGWKTGKFVDLTEELHAWDFDVIGITQTCLRERVSFENEEYKMINKGRSKMTKAGGGVGMVFRKSLNMQVDEINVGNSMMSEDIFAAKCEQKIGDTTECLIVVVCYMTTEGADTAHDNAEKYDIVKRVLESNRNSKVLVMGDVNGTLVH